MVCGQVTPCYPKETEGFVTEVIGLLDMHAATLESSLRQALVKALILMRNRSTVSPKPAYLSCICPLASDMHLTKLKALSCTKLLLSGMG